MRAVLKNIGQRSECTAVHTVTKGQYSPVRLKQARLASSLLYGIKFKSRPLLKNKTKLLMSIWQNPDQERNKRNARDNLKSTLPLDTQTKISLKSFSSSTKTQHNKYILDYAFYQWGNISWPCFNYLAFWVKQILFNAVHVC